MNSLVFLQKRQALTTSLIVAEYFEKRHDHIIRDIESQYGDLPEFGEMFHKATYPDSYGRKQKMYTMNRDGFFMLVCGFTGKKAISVRLTFIKAFNAMEQILLNQQNEEWQQIRRDGKEGNKRMCKVVHDYIIPLARAKGSTTPDAIFYMNYNKAVNRSACVQPNSRDSLSLSQLYEIEKMQEMTEV